MRGTIFTLLFSLFCGIALAQHFDESGNIKQLNIYQDSLAGLGKKFVNNDTEMERKNANYVFIKTLVSALKVPNSFLFKFDSVKTISIINAPDNRFRILTWHIANDDGSYRFYGTVQMNSGGNLIMYPLNDYSPLVKNPEDTVTDNTKWYGAQYYSIVPVYTHGSPYYLLLGWKGNTIKTNKKVIDVISFKNDKPVFGAPVFSGNGKTRKRVVFEYTRQASMLLKYEESQHLIVFDHLSPPDKKQKDNMEMYGPDLTYNGYALKDGRWNFVENLDMRNIPDSHDVEYTDPKKQAVIDRNTPPPQN